MRSRRPALSIPEVAIVDAVEKYFTTRGFGPVLREVQAGERFVDLMCADPSTGDIYAVEAKVSATQRAFQQAERYQLIADYSLVAMPYRAKNSTALTLAKETGIGLLLVDVAGHGIQRVDVCSPPIRSQSKLAEIAAGVWASRITR
jgi:hypothetical protein